MNKTSYFLDFEFDTGGTTLFPRPETELLVEKAVEIIERGIGHGAPCDILDLGTGCGNIAISLTKYLPSSRIVALDISDSSLAIAKENAAKHGTSGRIRFIKSDLFKGAVAAYTGYFDLIISNPPYVALGDFPSLPQAVRDDPYLALYGGKDGMKFYRRIIKEGPAFLNGKGVLLMETGYGQARSVAQMLAKSPFFGSIEIFNDYAGIKRIVKAEKGRGNRG